LNPPEPFATNSADGWGREEKVSAIASWGDFEVHFDGLLGRGGMGSVYRAWQKSVGRWVAVKVLESAPSVDPELQQGFLEKFQIEIRTLARLNDPRIVTILQSGTDDGKLWFAMELIDGETVEKRLTDAGAFDEEEAARIGIEVARALEAALRQQIHHRDVKPANIFLLRDGSVKLADFGLARGAELSRTRLTVLNAVACTPEYASPEQAEGRGTDHRSDLYSLGCVLYEMVTERPPFTGESPMATLHKHSAHPAPSLRVLSPSISRDFEAVVRRLLEKDPADRFQSYPELVDALLPPTEPMMRAAKPGEASRSWLWPASAAAGLTLLVLLLIAIVTAEVPPLPAEARAPDPPRPVPVEPLLAPPPEPLRDPPVELARVPGPPSLPPDPPVRKEDERRAFLGEAARALERFRASLPPAEESELVGEIPWGTWRPDLSHAPGGEARYDPVSKGYALAARLDSDRVWIKRPFAGCRAGYQVQFRFGPGSSSSRLALAISFTRWLEVTPAEAFLFRVTPEGRIQETDRAALEKAVPGGMLTILPNTPQTLVFLDDTMLFATPESDLLSAEGLQIGVSGGTVRIDSVRAKDRSR
jgi:serine/threonine protein kinase